MSRILIADDDVIQLDLRKMVLEIAGHHVDVAVSAIGVIRHIESERADLVIMDLRFPNAIGEPDASEGMALIRRIRELGCVTPVIVLSGWPEELYGKPEEQMVSRILMKPVMTLTLLEAIREVVA
uniref:Response regulator receiver protein n=1 Tax=Solibacter usitatus (strain Ellin6076) TaxID=234267 RepID=Q01R29_SOLUE